MIALAQHAPRSAASAMLGAAVTVGLVLVMQYLIRSDGAAPEQPFSGPRLTYLPLIEETPPRVEDDAPVEPPKPQSPPSTPPRPTADGTPIGTDVAATAPRMGDDFGPRGFGVADGPALPVVKVTPRYPARAQERGIEGYVLLEFTIDELGRVVSPRVLRAEPGGVFERAALRAVERFKYKPRIVNGQAVAVTGVQHRLTFELEGD